MQYYFGSQVLHQHGLEKVGGVGHSGSMMFQSECGLALLFDYDPSQSACNGSGGNNVIPTAGFSSSISNLTASFTDNSTDSDGSIASWSWNYGDGSSSIDTNPNHTYSAAGSYLVTLTVTDNAGDSDSFSDSVTVNDPVPQTPAAPTGLTGTVIQSGKGKNKVVTGITLNWSDNADNETGFVVEACKEEVTGKGKNKTVTCNFTQIGNLGSDTTDIDLVDLSNDSYQVKAVNDMGSSVYSNEVKI